MTTAPVEQDTSRPRPALFGSIGYLLMNLPVGILTFTLMLTLFSVTLGIVIIWLGLAVGAVFLLVSRLLAQVERARVYALLNTSIGQPYRPLPEGGLRRRYATRLRDAATWRDIGYLVLLFPIGVVEFCVVTVSWTTSLGMIGLPIYFRFLPEGAFYFPGYDVGTRWLTVDSTLTALPWTAVGLVLAVGAIALTKAMAAGHARFARAMLGVRRDRVRQPEPVTSPLVTGAVG